MKRLTLKAVWLNCDFRFSEATIYDQLVKKKKLPGPPKAGECYLFVSRTGNQLVWILNVTSSNGREIVDSRRWRIRRGIWSHHLMENYANEVGLSLVGWKRFEEVFLEGKPKPKPAQKSPKK